MILGAVSTDASCYGLVENNWVCPAYFSDRREVLWEATLQHLQITLAAVLLGLALAIPLALLARRSPRVEAVLLSGSTILYTVPSLAMFSLLVQFTGLTATTVVVGLALYSLAVLLRNILAGLRSVPEEVREAATGLGYSPFRLLLKVEAPLALPVMMAGLRVATVSTVALTTVGTIVSYGGLGNLLSAAVTTDFKAQIFAASIICVALAVVLDLLLVAVQRLAMPWARAGA